MEMKKIEITLCTGTMCYVTGGSNYFLLEENLSEQIMASLDIRGVTCLGHCKKSREGKFPCMVINGTAHFGLALDEAVAIIKEIYNTI